MKRILIFSVGDNNLGNNIYKIIVKRHMGLGNFDPKDFWYTRTIDITNVNKIYRAYFKTQIYNKNNFIRMEVIQDDNNKEEIPSILKDEMPLSDKLCRGYYIFEVSNNLYYKIQHNII